MTPKTTRITDRVMHWISAGLILALLTDMSTRMQNIDYQIKGIAQHKQDSIEVHVAMALALLLVLIARMVWYQWFLHEDYKLSYKNTRHKWLVRLVHSSMYGSCFLLMVSGIFMITNYEHTLTLFNIVDLSVVCVDSSLFYASNRWHEFFETSIYYLIAIHIAGAIYSRK